MIDLSSILQAISRLRPDMLQGLLGGQGGGMQSMNGGGFRAEPFAPFGVAPPGGPEGNRVSGPPWMSQPFEPMPIDPMPMPAKGGGFPTQVVPDAPGAGSGGRSAGAGMFGRGRGELPGLRQQVPDRLRGVPAMGGGAVGGNRIATRPAPGGRSTGGAIVRPSPGGRGGASVAPKKRRPNRWRSS